MASYESLVALFFFEVLFTCLFTDVATFQIRLENGGASYLGRVEVNFDDGYGWGTVCDDNWDVNEAKVACRNLGLPYSYAVPISRARFGNGAGEILMDNVNCTGSESYLNRCLHLNKSRHNCGHSEDAGVICWDLSSLSSVGDSFRGKIENPSFPNPLDGRLLLRTTGYRYSNYDISLCSNNFGIEEAKVACNELGHNSTTPVTFDVIGSPEEQEHLFRLVLDCRGSESRLQSCRRHISLGSCPANAPVAPGLACNYEKVKNVSLSGTRVTDDQIVWTSGKQVQVQCLTDYARPKPTLRWYLDNRPFPCLVQSTTFVSNTSLYLVESTLTITPTEFYHGKTLSCCSEDPTGYQICSNNYLLYVRGNSSFQIRLRDGGTSFMGRVEVNFDDGFGWGTVCDNNWDVNDAIVTCRSLGLPYRDAMPLGKAKFGQGEGEILMDNVRCTGTESSLSECQHFEQSQVSCDHSEDASVICIDISVGDSFSGYLENPYFANPTEGRVLIKTNGNRNYNISVCNNNFGTEEAKVACYELGYHSTPPVTFDVMDSTRIQEHLIRVVFDCQGSETKLSSCRRHIHIGSCPNNDPVAPGLSCNYVKVRRVTVYGSGRTDNNIVFTPGKQFYIQCITDFAQPKPRLQWYLDKPSSSLVQNATVETNNSMYQVKSTLTITPTENHNGKTLSCCSEDPTGYKICSNDYQLKVKVRRVTVYGSGRTDNNMVFTPGKQLNIQCLTDFAQPKSQLQWYLDNKPSSSLVQNATVESNNSMYQVKSTLTITPTENHNGKTLSCCSEDPTGYKICSNDYQLIDVSTFQIRLRDGATSFMGRVEVKLDDGYGWGTVCDDSWDVNDAMVACRSLNLPYSEAVPVSEAKFGQGTGDILMDNVECTGSESSLIECLHRNRIQENCGHSEDAGVICWDINVRNTFRGYLENPYFEHPRDGRLQLRNLGNSKYNISVCKDSFGMNDATVACHELGFNSTPPVIFDIVDGPKEQEHLFHLELYCLGSETSLQSCSQRIDPGPCSSPGLACNYEKVSNVFIYGTGVTYNITWTAEKQVEVHCITDFARPKPRLQWYLDNKPSSSLVQNSTFVSNTSMYQVKNTLTITPLDCHHGMTLSCCSEDPAGYKICSNDYHIHVEDDNATMQRRTSLDVNNGTIFHDGYIIMGAVILLLCPGNIYLIFRIRNQGRTSGPPSSSTPSESLPTNEQNTYERLNLQELSEQRGRCRNQNVYENTYLQ